LTETEARREQAPLLDASALPLTREVQRLEELLATRERVEVGNAWGSSQALLLATLAARPALAETTILAVASTDAEAEAYHGDLGAFGCEATLLPARDSGATDVASSRARLQLAQRLVGPVELRPRVVVASVLSLLQPLPAPRDLERERLVLRVGEVLSVERLLQRLVKLGYARQPLAEAPGEVSLRGDILDLFPFAAEAPVRVELLEDEIESLRTFDPVDQRSIETLRELELCLAADTADLGEGGGSSVAELLPASALHVLVEPLRVEERAEVLHIRSPAHERALRRMTKLRADRRQLALQSLPGADLSLDTRSVQALEVGMIRAGDALLAAGADGARVIVLCATQADEHRLLEVLSAQHAADSIETRIGVVTKGFRVPAWGLVVVNHHELKGVLGARRRKARRAHHKVKAIQSFFELKPGDLVVHAVHGLARYRGLVHMERAGGEEEHLHLSFADDVSLYVPSSRVDIVQRYIGKGASTLALDKIGGTAFRRRKERVQRGLFDLAAELIEVQAKRALRKRPSWRADEELVTDLVGGFPYEDTSDQAAVDLELETDLYGEHPMDRMICGDVGFGKTELAVRAAFRVVNGGGQVALLVPTTVLAQQHFETFRERLADFPVSIEVISRYVQRKAIQAALERAQKGELDILIGTHRILSKDVKFARLGLVIIDEEQRFGVQHKEHFKQLRAQVDLLTLTATPIPRTLHMSLSGLRDISALSVPPPGRQAIRTVLGYSDDDDAIRDAILREKARGGQAFFLHNRVQSIRAIAQRLQTLLPGVTFAVGHGQMGATELRAVMEAFTRGDADVLVATTIIENGIDIPTAGTILIDDADHFGLAELHQLRGRVGRGSTSSYCYLLVERNKPLNDVARERLKALEEMNHLGAGFGISIKDLELRGAGNVLGAEQSGHIAAVGYEMFCRLLKLTVDRLQSGEPAEGAAAEVGETEAGVELELGLRAFLPADWIPDADVRLELLRELAHVHTDEDARQAEEMLRDRFGRLPDEARALLRMFRLKARLDPHQLTRLAWHTDTYLIQYRDRVAFERLLGALPVELRRIKAGVAHLVIPGEHRDAEAALGWFEGLLEATPAQG
jgi:transcription-repair coupling factor (superfamily II helicase)